MYRKILVPLDGSTLAEAALPHAEALAKLEDAEIIILRVPPIPVTEFLAHDPNIAVMLVEDAEAQTQKYLQEKVTDLKARGFVKVTGVMRQGAVPDTILTAADEAGADLIVMSTHGRAGMQRWLMGSVADRVVHHAHIPVMLIRPG